MLKNVMVHLDGSARSETRLKIAVDLADADAGRVQDIGMVREEMRSRFKP